MKTSALSTYASTPGSTHRKLDYNNQDAVLVTEQDGVLIALVADGCGSGSNSEVGAQLALRFVDKFIRQNVERSWQYNLQSALLKYSQQLAAIHAEGETNFVLDHLLYTLLGIVIYQGEGVVFHCGDGVLYKDKELTVINQENRPRYINNELIGGASGVIQYEQVAYLQAPLLIASDGLEDFLEGIQKGLVEEYLSWSEFLEDDSLFSNPIALPQLLQKYARNGLLRDDASIALINVKP